MNTEKPQNRIPLKTCFLFFLLSLPVLLPLGCTGYVAYKQKQMDAADRLVDAMCEKDAGITVYEQVEAPAHYFQMPGKSLSTPNEDSLQTRPNYPYLIKPDYPYVRREMPTVYLLRGNPAVARHETQIISTADSAILSKSVRYSRIGGEPFFAQWFTQLLSRYPCKKHTGSIEFATYINYPPHTPFFRPRITYELRKKTP